ncbi:MAG: hypothetical protein IM556_03780, partial [Pseudanabaena sp. M110S1SP2A07QC]|nr:hypothetical protein [Pseudanabaena sp. M110S1SP2A07QC]
QISDPKERLEKLLIDASFPRSRGKQVNIPSNYCVRVAEMIDDFEPLRNLSAFQELEKELKATLNEHFPDLLS